jgi:hypothetical protein
MKQQHPRSVLHQRLERQVRSSELLAKKSQEHAVLPARDVQLFFTLVHAMYFTQERDFSRAQDELINLIRSPEYQQALDALRVDTDAIAECIEVTLKEIAELKVEANQDLSEHRKALLHCAKSYCSWLEQQGPADSAQQASV